MTDPETVPSLCVPEVLWLPPLGEGALASWGGGEGGHQLPALTTINTPTAQPLQTFTLGSKNLSALQIPLQTMSRLDPSDRLPAFSPSRLYSKPVSVPFLMSPPVVAESGGVMRTSLGRDRKCCPGQAQSPRRLPPLGIETCLLWEGRWGLPCLHGGCLSALHLWQHPFLHTVPAS